MPSTASQLQRYRRALEGLLGVPATEGNQADILRNGDQIFPAMLTAIGNAEHTIDLCTYVYWTGQIAVQFADALSGRAEAGVRARVLLDAVGAHKMDSGLTEQMTQAGASWEWFRPPTRVRLRDAENRTHRKVMVCDEAVGFTGGVGIAEEWEGNASDPSQWRDTHVRVRGPAVDGLRACFVGNWAEAGGEVFSAVDRFPEQPKPGEHIIQVVQSPSQFGWSDLCTAFHALITLAQRRLRISTAYFVPDEHFRDLLVAAAKRGVQVDVLVPGTHADKRVVQIAGEADYDELLAAGVRIWHYEKTMLHTKIITVDGLVASVGSANFDARSLRLNEEANINIFDADVVGQLDADFEADVKDAVRIEPGRWERRGLTQRARETVTELFDHKL